MKFERGKFIFYISLLTIEIYAPFIWWNNQDYGISLHTGIIGKRYNKLNEWWVSRAIAIKLLGFGIGFAWKHIDNPNMDIKNTD